MSRRGPDGTGEWFSRDGRVGLGHRRLAIIDLSPTGAQPMAIDDGRFVITFNGEIYNYRRLRMDLERQGCRFRSESDTEVILRLYEKRGPEAMTELRGMFALAIWDAERRGVLLARDPFGIKPLYYADDGSTLRVASQVRALRAHGISSDPDPAGVAGFLLYGSVPEPHTFLREVRALPAGHTLWVDARGPATPHRYFTLAKIFSSNGDGAGADDRSASAPEAAERAREAFLDSVRHHLIADVEVGAFLSAGVDSSAIVSLAMELGSAPLRTVTLSFEEFKGTPADEAPFAEETARRLGTRHETRIIGRADFLEEVPRLMEAMDQPTIDGVNTYFVSWATAQTGLKVALSGLGGDELLGGYPTFRDLPWMVRAACVPSRIPGLGRLARPVLSAMMGQRIPKRYASFLEQGGSYGGAYLLRRGLFGAWELPELIGRDMAVEGLERLESLHLAEDPLQPDPGTPFARISVLEASLYMRNQLLRDSDWASMAHGLELRVPLVDVPLWRALASISSASAPSKKSLLARSTRPALPDAILHRPKTGFSIPVWEWIASSRAFDAWRGVRSLEGPGRQGARRWAYSVLESFVGSSVASLG